MGMLGRIDNLDVLCRDLDAMVRFYHDVLGLPFFLPYQPGQDWAAIQAGDVTVYILQTPAGDGQPRRTSVTKQDPPGIDSFAFEVADLQAAVAELDGKVSWAGPAEVWEHPGGTFYRHRAFYDPEGNLLHITEPHKVTTDA
jgi:catechol 2,3-dioxygenase-like lactoylglutathione lyase family enzyme